MYNEDFKYHVDRIETLIGLLYVHKESKGLKSQSRSPRECIVSCLSEYALIPYPVLCGLLSWNTANTLSFNCL